jgi:hypothetical protein
MGALELNHYLLIYRILWIYLEYVVPSVYVHMEFKKMLFTIIIISIPFQKNMNRHNNMGLFMSMKMTRGKE